MNDEDSELNALYAVVGRLVVEYARAEAYVHFLACRVMGDDAVGLVVFNGMRFGELADRIRGILRTQKASDDDYVDIDSCLTQLALIGKVRPPAPNPQKATRPAKSPKSQRPLGASPE